MRGVRVGQCGTDTEIVADTANIRKTNRVNWQLPPERAGDTGIYRGVMRGPGTVAVGTPRPRTRRQLATCFEPRHTQRRLAQPCARFGNGSKTPFIDTVDI